MYYYKFNGASKTSGATEDIGDFWKNSYPQKNSTTICAVKMRRNIESGYTVEYPKAGASFEQTLLAYASAGGSVYVPAIIPMMVK